MRRSAASSSRVHHVHALREGPIRPPRGRHQLLEDDARALPRACLAALVEQRPAQVRQPAHLGVLADQGGSGCKGVQVNPSPSPSIAAQISRGLARVVCKSGVDYSAKAHALHFIFSQRSAGLRACLEQTSVSFFAQ